MEQKYTQDMSCDFTPSIGMLISGLEPLIATKVKSVEADLNNEILRIFMGSTKVGKNQLEDHGWISEDTETQICDVMDL